MSTHLSSNLALNLQDFKQISLYISFSSSIRNQSPLYHNWNELAGRAFFGTLPFSSRHSFKNSGSFPKVSQFSYYFLQIRSNNFYLSLNNETFSETTNFIGTNK